MTKRVSIKGRGADLFFGDYEPEHPASLPAPTAHAEAADAAATDAIIPADDRQKLTDVSPDPPTSTLESPSPIDMHARKHESTKARMHAPSADMERESIMPADLPDKVWDLIAEQATITNAFRYTDQDLTTLADVLYDITKRHRVKISKQDVARLGLNAVLQDYQQRGDASLLGELARRKKRSRGGSD